MIKNLFRRIPTWNTIGSPNFSIIVPGPCNCKCGFCFWNVIDHFKIPEEVYFYRLNKVLMSHPKQFRMLSLTGGEPTLSPYIEKILSFINKDKWEKVVFTTNGTKLTDVDMELLREKVDFINISRHHIDDRRNESIFGCSNVPNTEQLCTIIDKMNRNGIPVTLNCVLEDLINIRDFIKYAKEVNASNVCFRKIHSENSDLLPVQQEIELQKQYQKTGEFSCPVCVTTSYIVDGMEIKFKSSIPEPSDLLNEEIYETIFHEDGMLTADWSRMIEIEV